MQRFAVLAALLLAASLSGCVGFGEGDDAGVDNAPEQPRPRSSQFTGDGWADLAEADIRPGIQVYSALGSQCTANFLFRSPDNRTLYLGVSAHCLTDENGALPPGSPVTSPRGGATGTRIGEVGWSAWQHGADLQTDFALIKLDNSPQVRGGVHPAVMHYGGPTGLAVTADVLPGSKLISYGHSGGRGHNNPDNPREGWLTRHDEARFGMVFDHPGIPGDSGSGVMTAAGLAIGALSTKTIDPLGALDQREMPTHNEAVGIDAGLRLAAADGVVVELVTWPLLQGPGIPV